MTRKLTPSLVWRDIFDHTIPYGLSEIETQKVYNPVNSVIWFRINLLVTQQLLSRVVASK